MGRWADRQMGRWADGDKIKALSLGERVSRSGVFISRGGPGEGVHAIGARGLKREEEKNHGWEG